MKTFFFKGFTPVKMSFLSPLASFSLGSVHANGIEKYRALEYSPLILKLQVTLTKRLSFKTTFKGHSIIKYLNHASTKDVINIPKPVSDLDIFKDYLLCTAEHCFLRSRKPKLYGDIKSRHPKITAAKEKKRFKIFE